MTITISPTTESMLRQTAEMEVRDPDSVADRLLADALTWAQRDRAEAIAGIQRGLDDVAAGRAKPLSQAVSEARERYDYAESWPHDHASTEEDD